MTGPALLNSVKSALLPGGKFHHFCRPPFRHADAFVPIGCSVIGLADMIVADMGKFGFDSVWVPFPTLVEQT